MTSSLQDRRRRAHDKLRALAFEPMMRGSLVERQRKCGKPYCACATDPERAHPQACLSVKVDGRQHTLHLRPEQLDAVRQRLDAYRRLWELVEELTSCEVDELRAEARTRRANRRA